jgi:hypothetical protein
MIRKILFSLAAVQISVVSFAYATPTTITFEKNANYWPGYYPQGNPLNGVAVIGDPDITGGTVTVNNGQLTSINFNYTAPDNDWEMLAPGNLFISIVNSANYNAKNTTWDYVVNTMGDPTKNSRTSNPSGYALGTNVTVSKGYYSIYNISSLEFSSGNVNNNHYILSGTDNTGIWTGYDIRENHPIGINCSYLKNNATKIGKAYFSGFGGLNTLGGSFNDNTSPYSGSSTYYFNGHDLPSLYGDTLIIGWETTCANDVVYEAVPVPSPEPSTFVLLGIGLFGAGLVRRRILN